MSNFDPIGDRMKAYEQRFAQQALPNIPIIARIDGRAFHKFTMGLERPYDQRLSSLMKRVLKTLVFETGAKFGYTQSDEISLLFYNSNVAGGDTFFGGKFNKINSVVASMTTAYFNRDLVNFILEKRYQIATFDCRSFEINHKDDVLMYFKWRENDAVRNSIQMAARSVYSHSECNEKNQRDLHDMLYAKGINWNDYPIFFKRGTYCKRVTTTRKYTPEEIELLPKLHQARKNPDLTFSRQDVSLESQNGFEVGRTLEEKDISDLLQ